MRKNRERGFTLLEYCAGAAALVAIVYVSMQTLGNNLSTSFGSINTWMTSKVGADFTKATK